MKSIYALLLLFTAGCQLSPYLSPEKQAETGFTVGHRYILTAQLVCVDHGSSLGSKARHLSSIRTPEYKGLTMDNGRKKWERETHAVKIGKDRLVELPAGTIVQIEAINHPTGESGTDVDIVTKIVSGDLAGSFVDVRDICDAKYGWSDGTEVGIWVFLRDDRYIREVP